MVAHGLWAGLAAGWICFVVGHWVGLLRLPIVDLAAAGRRYLDAPVAGWVFGLVHHLANSALLGVGYVAILDATGWLDTSPLIVDIATGTVFGVAVWAVLAMSLVLPGTGRGWFGAHTDDKGPIVANLVVHVVYGAALGLLAA